MLKRKKANGKMTIEKLARMSQQEFAEIHGEFADVRKEMREGFNKIEEDMGILRRDTETGFQSIGEVLRLMREDLKEIKTNVITTHEDYAELRIRVERLEKKIGLAR